MEVYVVTRTECYENKTTVDAVFTSEENANDFDEASNAFQKYAGTF